MVNVSIVKGACKAGLMFLKANAPTIMTVAGVGCMGASTVLAVRGAKDASMQEEIKSAQEECRMMESFVGEMIESGKSPAEMCRKESVSFTKDEAIAGALRSRIKLIGAYCKPYIPAAACFVAGVGLILAAHGIMLKRNAALGTALETVGAAFAKYRQNVVEMSGEDADQQYLNGGKVADVETEDPETGEKKTVEKALIANPTAGPLDVWFSDANPNYSKNPAVNAHFLHACEKTMQAQLDYEGQYSWAEALKFMAFDNDGLDSAQAQKVAYAIGWKRGDVIDLGISELYNQSIHDPESLFKGDVMLHPNCTKSMFDTKFLGVVQQHDEQVADALEGSAEE